MTSIFKSSSNGNIELIVSNNQENFMIRNLRSNDMGIDLKTSYHSKYYNNNNNSQNKLENNEGQNDDDEDSDDAEFTTSCSSDETFKEGEEEENSNEYEDCDYDQNDQDLDSETKGNGNLNEQTEQEFEFIFERVKFKTNSMTNNLSNVKLALKFLYKVLKAYKLDHYIIDLVEHGYFSPILLNKLKLSDLEIFNISPYDKKKFHKLKIFIKKVISSIKAKNNNKNILNDFDFNKLLNQNEEMLNRQKNETKKNVAKHIKEPVWPEVRNVDANNNKMIVNSTRNFTNKSNVEQNFTTQQQQQQPYSVCHPKTHQIRKKNSTTYFGPRLAINQMQSNQNNNNDVAQVHVVANKNYNYGVPNQPQNNKRSKSFIRKVYTTTGRSKSNIENHHNQGQIPCSTAVKTDIFVYARKRPKLPCEAKYSDVICIDNSENGDENEYLNQYTPPTCNSSNQTNTICVDEIKNAVDGTPVLRKNEFTFDKTFDSLLTNEDIFRSSISPFISNTSNSNKSDFTCICFGQTGSGKTHTLFGNKQQDGICILTAQRLFTGNEKFLCGFYEIYNGQLFDLINKNNKLVLREDASGQVNVVGLVEIEIKSIAQLRKTIETAQSNRHIGCTSFNKSSSRSHAVLQLKVPNLASSTNLTSNNEQVIYKPAMMNSVNSIKSKVNSGLGNKGAQTPKPFRILFIDLAGSERGIDAQNNLNDNRKEGAEINQSLLALKECIRCIDQYYTHAPFRQSKLTRVLRDCFIGSGKTVLIATVSPTEDCVSCSLNTLQYANRVRQMTLRNRIKSPISSQAINNENSENTSGHRLSLSTKNKNGQLFNNNKSRNFQSQFNFDCSPVEYMSCRGIQTRNTDFKNSTNQKNSNCASKNNSSAAKSVNTNLNSRHTTGASSFYNGYNENLNSEIKRSESSKSILANKKTETKPSKSSIMIKAAFGSSNYLATSSKSAFFTNGPSSSKSSTAETANLASSNKPQVISSSSALSSSSKIMNANSTSTTNNHAPNTAKFSTVNLIQHKVQIHEQTPTTTTANVPLFHPSKINMSSTPIKLPNNCTNSNNANNNINSNNIETNLGKSEVATTAIMLFDNDTPIKGHKIKYMINEQAQLVKLAERYFPRVQQHQQESENIANHSSCKQHNNIYGLNNKAYSDELNRKVSNNFEINGNANKVEQQNKEFISKSSIPFETKQEERLGEVSINDDYQLMLMNKSLFKKQMFKSIIFDSASTISNKKTIDNFKYIYSSISPPPTTTAILANSQSEYFLANNVAEKLVDQRDEEKNSFSFLHDESLRRLREKQRELFKSTKKIYSNTNENLNESNDMNTNSKLLQVSDLITNNDNTSQLLSEDVLERSENNDFNNSLEKYKSVANSQKQLRIYIQNLENKLDNLRNEMKDNANSSASVIANTNMTNIASNITVQNNAIDGLKKVRERSVSTDSNDSLREIKINTKISSTSRTQLFNEFLDRRRNAEKQSVTNGANIHVNDGEDFEKSFIEMQLSKNKKSIKTDNVPDNNLGNDILEKSLHKSSLTDLIFARSKKANQQENLVKKCDFTPILSSNCSNLMPECKLVDNSQQETMFKTSFYASTSKMSEQHLVNPKPIRLSSSSSSFDSSVDQQQRNYNLIMPHNKHNNSNNNNNNNNNSSSPPLISSSRSNSSTYSNNNLNANSNSKIWKVKAGNANNSGEKNKWSAILQENNSEATKSVENNVKNNSASLKSKDLLVDDLAKTCKEEMNLINCLKESQVETFEGYLSRIEEMLSKKVNSIRGLQSQLKTQNGKNDELNIVKKKNILL